MRESEPLDLEDPQQIPAVGVPYPDLYLRHATASENRRLSTM
jgi:hypothetical protein